LYCRGDLDFYTPIASATGRVPIYVGKAVPAGSRIGRDQLAPPATTALYRRLREHAKSIAAAENLTLVDFDCRYLTVQPVWTPLAEQVLLHKFRPVWNSVVDGFGNHPPGRGRRNMRRPRWDIIHRGRAWALELEPAEEPEAIMRDVCEHLREWPAEG
jgi:hypothetical protein